MTDLHEKLLVEEVATINDCLRQTLAVIARQDQRITELEEDVKNLSYHQHLDKNPRFG